MSDQRIRSVEFHYLNNQSPEDALLWLSQVSRARSLRQEEYSWLAALSVEGAANYLESQRQLASGKDCWLETMAAFGHPPAFLALGLEPEGEPDANRILGQLADWDPKTQVEWFLAVVRQDVGSLDGCSLKAFQALEGWVQSPCEESSERVFDATEAASSRHQGWRDEPESVERGLRETTYSEHPVKSAIELLLLAATQVIAVGRVNGSLHWILWALSAIAERQQRPLTMLLDQAAVSLAWLMGGAEPQRRASLREVPLRFEEAWLRPRLRKGPYPDKAQILEYLIHGDVIGVAGVTPKDVLDDAKRLLGPGKRLSDGVWAWSSHLAHFVSCYDVALPQDFLEHGRRIGWSKP